MKRVAELWGGLHAYHRAPTLSHCANYVKNRSFGDEIQLQCSTQTRSEGNGDSTVMTTMLTWKCLYSDDQKNPQMCIGPVRTGIPDLAVFQNETNAVDTTSNGFHSVRISMVFSDLPLRCLSFVFCIDYLC